MEVIQLQIKNCRLKLVGTAQMLIIDNVKGIEDVLALLTRMKKPEVITEDKASTDMTSDQISNSI